MRGTYFLCKSESAGFRRYTQRSDAAFNRWDTPHSTQELLSSSEAYKMRVFFSFENQHFPSFDSTALSEYDQASFTTMCRWRQIQDTFATCGHSYRLVYCPEPDCKFSPLHPTDCPNCTTTCWQYRRFPEIINRQFGRLCPRCEEVAASGRR
ncbi:hypothetical protein BJ165DRAFT_1441347 [Panaeolus papilionaceus]|nr:hypothetical protein BJ165DRAFT_1441347 [Panaeolus papilionaceus]